MSLVPFKELSPEACVFNAECFFFVLRLCLHILCNKLFLDMRSKSSQCKTAELPLTMITVSKCDLNTLTSHDSALVRGRPTLKGAEQFRTGSIIHESAIKNTFGHVKT